MVDYNPLSPEARDGAAHQAFAQLRSSCPVHYQKIPDDQVISAEDGYLVTAPTHEFWSVFRYSDCMRMLQETDVFSSKEGPGPERGLNLTEDGMLLTADNPVHRRQRQIANQAFFPRMIEQRRPLMESTITSLLDRFADQGSLDVIEDLGTELTTTLITDIIGVGADRRGDLKRWAIDIITGFGGDPSLISKAIIAVTEFSTFLLEIITARRATLADGGTLPDDMLSVLITAEAEGTRFTDEEILMACHQMLGAGYETTTTGLGNAVHLLCTNPGERGKLEADWTLIDAAIEEVLRIESPVEGTFRTTTREVEVAGTTIPAGAKVRVVYASANRDDSVFEDPTTFRIDRPLNQLRKHVAFAHGIHSCLGAALARMEMRMAVEMLFRRFPGLELDPDNPPVRNTGMTINGYTSLAVRWDPAQARPLGDLVTATAATVATADAG
jgi:cytochrome P450